MFNYPFQHINHASMRQKLVYGYIHLCENQLGFWGMDSVIDYKGCQDVIRKTVQMFPLPRALLCIIALLQILALAELGPLVSKPLSIMMRCLNQIEIMFRVVRIVFFSFYLTKQLSPDILFLIIEGGARCIKIKTNKTLDNVIIGWILLGRS